jgi:GGDEF domain-containing protein
LSRSPTVTVAANEPSAVQRGTRSAGLPWVGSMESLDLHMSRRLALCRRSCEQMALLWIEVELLTAPGGEAGAAADNELLQAAGQRLRNRVRGTDEVVQVAGLGFAVLLHGAGADTTERVEQRLQQALTGAYGMDSHRLYLGVRMGRALFPDAGRSGRQLAEAACQDLALRQGG